MIGNQFLDNQLDRLSCLDGFPQTESAKKAIAQALLETFHDEQDLAMWVMDWLRTETRSPKPAHIYAVRRAPTEAELVESLKHGPKCSICDDTGWKQAAKGGVERCGHGQ